MELERLIYPWTKKAKDKWQTQQSSLEHKSCSYSFLDQQNKALKMSRQISLERSCLKRSCWRKPRELSPHVLSWNREKEDSSSSTLPNDPWYLVLIFDPSSPAPGPLRLPLVSSTRTALGAKVTSNGWFLPANPVLPRYCPSSILPSAQLMAPWSPPATVATAAHVLGQSFQLTVHSTISSLPELFFTSYHSTLACSYPFLCPKCQCQISFCHLNREV